MGGSGGGSSGTIAYPPYMVAVHGEWLNSNGTSAVAHDMVTAMNTAFSANPYTGVVAYDPDTDIADYMDALSDFRALILQLNAVPSGPETDFELAYTKARELVDEELSTLDTTTLDVATLDTTTLDVTTQDTSPLDTQAIDNVETSNDINEYSAILEDQLNNVTLPAYKAAMLNIGALNTSSFVIGEALLRAFKDRDVARYGADLRSKIEVQLYELNARHMLSRRELDARHAISYRTITAEHERSYQQITAQHKQTFQTITAAHKQSFKRIESELARSYRELEARHKIQRGDIIRQSVAGMLAELIRISELWFENAKLVVEAKRIKIVAKKEEVTEQTDFDDREALWEMQTFAFGGNLLASIAGGVHQNQQVPNKAMTALSGALSGAAAGAAVGAGFGGVGAPVGAAAGVLVGVGTALLSNR